MTKANVFLLCIILMASFASLSPGLLINGLQIRTIEVRGALHCTLTGNLNAPPVLAATIVLNSDGSTTNLGQAVTTPSGVFTIIVKVLDTTLFDHSFYHVTVKFPVATCSVFPPDGVVFASVRLVNVVQTNVGNIAHSVIGIFRNI